MSLLLCFLLHFKYERSKEEICEKLEKKGRRGEGKRKGKRRRRPPRRVGLLYHKPEAKGEIADINTELKELRAKVRMCNNILVDLERINEKYNEAQRLEQEAMTPQKHKKKDKKIIR